MVCPKSQSQTKTILIHDPYHNVQEFPVEFRLTYEGLLPSSGNNPHGTDKHRIRKHFHIQLKKLWSEHEALIQLKNPDQFPPAAISSFAQRIKNIAPDETRIWYLASQFQRCNHRFVPLVTQDLSLWCGVDILFLRPGLPGKVLQSGDIDGRIKTLFDALKMPQQMQDLGEYGNNQVPADEDPFYCLLEDDSLISQASVETDRLLEFISGDLPHNDDARIVITVKLKPLMAKWENIGFV